MQIGLATVGQNGDMGANLSTARDFLELHERLSEDMKVIIICHSLYRARQPYKNISMLFLFPVTRDLVVYKYIMD